MIIKTSSITAILLAFLVMTSCGSSAGDFTSSELSLIHSVDSIMRVLTIDDPADSFVLRNVSRNLSAEAIASEDFKRLSELMIATVSHPSQDGVGIAGPQVGLNRRVVAVQRFDKEGEPFEVYANVRIVWASDSLAYGPEGCLSVPSRREEVLRSQEIVIEYADLASLSLTRKTQPSDKQELTLNRPRRMEQAIQSNTLKDNKIRMTRDTVRGFTAVIFQHEIDHLDGILYIDRL